MRSDDGPEDVSIVRTYVSDVRFYDFVFLPFHNGPNARRPLTRRVLR